MARLDGVAAEKIDQFISKKTCFLGLPATHDGSDGSESFLDLSFDESNKSFRRLATVKANLQSNLIGTRRGNRLRLIRDNYSLSFFVVRRPRPIDVLASIVRMKNTVLGC